MKSDLLLRILIAVALLPASCATTSRNSSSPDESGEIIGSKGSVPAAGAANGEEDEYAVAEVADPLEKLNRGVFWFNDSLYTVLFRPISKGYEFVFPRPVRKGIDNAFENAKFPVRLVNSTLQGKLKLAGQETGKFFVNSVFGVGGVYKYSDRIPELVDLSAEDSGQTLAKWGVGHGPYIVLPLFGPSSAREAVGLAGDYALNPVNWGWYFHGHNHDWTLIPPAANTLRSMPEQLKTYDTARENALDEYLAVRSSYIQARAEAARK
jgi:phospholipid-binding lipoprotein MlaA